MPGMKVREPAVAGQFYTADPYALAREVEDYLAGAPDSLPQPRAIIVPHAGHVYSGPVAAFAYKTLHETKRVVLMGPSHFVPVRGIAAPVAEAWRSPLGLVDIDTERIGDLGLQRSDYPHSAEHSLEVQLPFLQEQLEPGWQLLPLLVGRATPDEVADVLVEFLVEPETTVVLSTDLSHYLPYDEARQRDAHTAQRVVERDWRHIADEDACGAYPLRGLLLAAERLSLPVQMLDLRNSGDTAGPRDRVVGYGAFTVGA